MTSALVIAAVESDADVALPQNDSAGMFQNKRKSDDDLVAWPRHRPVLPFMSCLSSRHLHRDAQIAYGIRAEVGNAVLPGWIVKSRGFVACLPGSGHRASDRTYCSRVTVHRYSHESPCSVPLRAHRQIDAKAYRPAYGAADFSARVRPQPASRRGPTVRGS